MSPVGPVTDETVELLRRHGAPEDLVTFAERHVVRFSRKDMDREWWTGFWSGAVLTAVMFVAGLVMGSRP